MKKFLKELIIGLLVLIYASLVVIGGFILLMIMTKDIKKTVSIISQCFKTGFYDIRNRTNIY
jgi:hypothetical protein